MIMDEGSRTGHLNQAVAERSANGQNISHLMFPVLKKNASEGSFQITAGGCGIKKLSQLSRISDNQASLLSFPAQQLRNGTQNPSEVATRYTKITEKREHNENV